MKEIVIPYFQTKRKKLDLATNHSGLIIMDAVTGQTTDAVQNLLKKNNTFFTKVTANMTNLFRASRSDLKRLRRILLKEAAH